MDVLRLRVERAPDAALGDHQVLIFVNEVEMTSKGAGLGMDPYRLLVPNRLVAEAEPRTVGVARCGCGVYGCGATDVTIRREGDVVHWDWSIEVPMERRATFAADAYDAELERVAADVAWETPDRTAGRLLLTTVDRNPLVVHQLDVDWVANDWRDPELFQVALRQGTEYQILLEFLWAGRSPEELVAEVRDVLERQAPQEWLALWHSIQGVDVPPACAGPGWGKWAIGR